MVAVLVAVTGVAGVRQARASATADLRSAQQLASIDVGPTSIAETGASSTDVDAAGHLLLPLQLLVFNGGDQPVEVIASATSLLHISIRQPVPVSIAPGRTAVLDLTLSLDCVSINQEQDTTPAGTGDPAPGQWLRLGVARDGTSSQRYLIGDHVGGDLAGQVIRSCQSARGT